MEQRKEITGPQTPLIVGPTTPRQGQQVDACSLEDFHTVEPGLVAPARDFPLAVIGTGSVVHYVDDYRSTPGRTLCGRAVEGLREGRTLESVEHLCTPCARSEWPTRAEFEAYGRCTDCGIDCRAFGETAYTVRYRVWGQAYPGYNEEGIGVGDSRPCIGCLEDRLGRRLTPPDFYFIMDLDEAARYGIRISARLRDRWTGTTAESGA